MFLCLVIVVIAWPEESSHLAAGSENPQTDPPVQNNEDRETLNAGDFLEEFDEPDFDEPDEDNQHMEPDENQDIGHAADTYYLVRRDGSYIKVFFVDEDGDEIPLETTDIVYEVLGSEDQKLFDEGYRVPSQEELAVLLQDFES